LGQRRSPLFRSGDRGVDEGLGQVEFAAVAAILREALQQ
jgi:hypothetical protein